MKFIDTKLKGVFIIEPDVVNDERGFFACMFSEGEFKNHGIKLNIRECGLSYNARKGTLRGMHHREPYSEAKLVRCTKGAIYDVVIDLRKSSALYCKWVAVELTAENRKMIYIPEGFAHGFQTLEDDTEVFYQMTELYAPEYARTVRWNDPAFKIKWPLDVSVISEKDKNCSLIDNKHLA